MSDARSRALQSWKSGHFKKVSTPPFNLQSELATDHGFLNYRAQYQNVIGPDFCYLAEFLCHVTLKSAETSVPKSQPLVPYGTNLLILLLLFRSQN